MRTKKKYQKSFTLLELVVVFVVVGIVSSMAIVNYLNTIERIRAKEGEEILIALLGAQKRYAQENDGSYAGNISNLDVTTRTSAYFNTPAVSTTSPLAQITRTNSYTLSISDTGNVSCSGGASGLCTKLGY